MIWKLPPEIKIYEALGAVGDGRVRVGEDGGSVSSSAGDKEYTVVFDGGKAVMTNDNGSFWQGYLGYPGIAFLMLKGILTYSEKVSKALAGINWKEINDRFKRDYEKSVEYALDWASDHGVSRDEVVRCVQDVMRQMEEMGFEKLGKRMRPPKKKILH